MEPPAAAVAQDEGSFVEQQQWQLGCCCCAADTQDVQWVLESPHHHTKLFNVAPIAQTSCCVVTSCPHPLVLQKAHEYTRALNAAKLERIFAKPFIASLTHADGITCLARNPKALNSLLSGTADGDIRIWDIPAKRTLRRLEGHTAAVKGISFAPDGDTCVSCSTDCTVRQQCTSTAMTMQQLQQHAFLQQVFCVQGSLRA